MKPKPFVNEDYLHEKMLYDEDFKNQKHYKSSKSTPKDGIKFEIFQSEKELKQESQGQDKVYQLNWSKYRFKFEDISDF
jgi:hypothetical protein